MFPVRGERYPHQNALRDTTPCPWWQSMPAYHPDRILHLVRMQGRLSGKMGRLVNLSQLHGQVVRFGRTDALLHPIDARI